MRLDSKKMPEAATWKTNTEMMVMVTKTVMTTVRVSRLEKESSLFFIQERMDQQNTNIRKNSQSLFIRCRLRAPLLHHLRRRNRHLGRGVAGGAAEDGEV